MKFGKLIIILSILLSGCKSSTVDISNHSAKSSNLKYLEWLENDSVELSTRNDIKDQVLQAYLNEDFASLEAMASEFRNSEEKTSSGVWKLSWFYRSFHDLTATYRDKDRFYEEQLQVIRRWIEQFPDSPTGYIVYSEILHSKAFSYRGKDWDEDARDDKNARYKSELNRNFKHLEYYRYIAATDPQWHVIMANTLRGLGAESEEFWQHIKEGISDYPYYQEIYFAAAMYYSPRWYGDPEQVDVLARQAVDKTFDKLGESMYVRVYWSAASLGGDVPIYLYDTTDWDMVIRSMRDVLSEYPDQWNINHFAYFSCLKGDVQTLAALLQMLKTPIKSAWRSTEVYNLCLKAAEGIDTQSDSGFKSLDKT